MTSEKVYKVLLKQRRPHKSGFRIGRHLVTMGKPKEYELNEAEHKELQMDGPKAWVKVVTQEEMAALPKTNAENREMQELKALLVDRVELTGEETIDHLKALVEEVQMYDALVEAAKEEGHELTGEETIEDLEELVTE